jgi:hypothetical protein
MEMPSQGESAVRSSLRTHTVFAEGSRFISKRVSIALTAPSSPCLPGLPRSPLPLQRCRGPARSLPPLWWPRGLCLTCNIDLASIGCSCDC